MKIAWVINLYPPYIMGGNEMIAKDVMLELRNRGHEVYLLTGRAQTLPRDQYHRSPINCDLEHMAERFLGTRSPSPIESLRWHIFDPRTYRATVQTLREIEPDLIVIDNFSLISVAPLLAALRVKSKVVIHVLDKWLIYSLKKLGGLWHCPAKHLPLVVGVQLLVQPIVDRMARHIPIIVNSHFMKKVYIEGGFTPKRLSVAHLGIDVEIFRARVNRKQLGQPVRLMFAGMFWSGKGPQTAILALAELKKQAPEKKFVLDFYGKGTPEFTEYMDGLAKRSVVADSIRYQGFVSQVELAEAFHSHDIFLFTSIWDEPFSITLLQAMSSGIPVISTTVGGNPEAVEHRQTGLLIPPDDPLALAKAILELVEHQALRCHLSHQASIAVREKWSFEHYIDSLENLHKTYVNQ